MWVSPLRARTSLQRPDELSSHREQLVQRLLRDGLEFFGRGHKEVALARWRRVLEFVPNHPEALDYIESATATAPLTESVPPLPSDVTELSDRRQRSSSRPSVPPDGDPRQVGPRVIRLLQQRAYDEALALLNRARALNPTDPSLSKSIRHIKDLVQRTYLRKMGSLDAVPVRTAKVCNPEAGVEATLMALVDGISTYGDLLDVSSGDRVQSMRVLCSFVDRGWIRSAEEGHTPAIEAVSASLAMPPSSPPIVEAAPRFAFEGAIAPITGVLARPRSEGAVAPLGGGLGGGSASSPHVVFQLLFHRAMDAYLDRDYATAAQGLEQCLELRPDNEKVRFNLERIRELLRKTPGSVPPTGG